MMQLQLLNLKHYISVTTQLAFIAANIAKECAQNPNLKKYQKGINDPVTQADFKIQTMICRGLRHFFPNIRIIGEETIEYKGEIELNLQAITLDHYPQEVVLNQNISLSQVVVWIDPIDNTKGFIKGTLDAVTVLIGLSWNNKAEVGIIACPYQLEGKIPVYRPQVIVGVVSGKKAFTSRSLGTWTEMQAPKKNNPLKMVISDSRGMSKTVEYLLAKYKAQLYRIGGSGKKIVQVIKGSMDILLYLKAANHKWDSCAGEAIILALGGYFTDSKKHAITYDANNADTVNRQGNICAYGEQFFDGIMNEIISYSQKIE